MFFICLTQKMPSGILTRVKHHQSTNWSRNVQDFLFNDIQLCSQNAPSIVADTSNSSWSKFFKSICNYCIFSGSVFSSGSVFQCSKLFEHLWMYNLWHNQLKSYCTYFVLQTYPVLPLNKRFWVLRNLTLKQLQIIN